MSVRRFHREQSYEILFGHVNNVHFLSVCLIRHDSYQLDAWIERILQEPSPHFVPINFEEKKKFGRTTVEAISLPMGLKKCPFM